MRVEKLKSENGKFNAHKHLVEVGAQWLKNTARCSVVLKELVAATTNGENPDVIGFNSSFSFLIECKTSRSDYFADQKKIFRTDQYLGMGEFRFIMCPAGLIEPNEVYDGWGLLWVRNQKVYQQNCKITNMVQKGVKFFEPHYNAERTMLVSHLRRLENKING